MVNINKPIEIMSRASLELLAQQQQAEIDQLTPTDEQITSLLERWDVTEPELKRKIFAAMLMQQQATIDRLLGELRMSKSLNGSHAEFVKQYRVGNEPYAKTWERIREALEQSND